MGKYLVKRIMFRADANSSIGTGDLLSLIHLSEYFSPKEWTCYFMVRSYFESTKIIERVKSDNVFFIDKNSLLSEEVEQINKVVSEYDIDVLFFEITERKISEYIGLDTGVKKMCVNFDSSLLEDLLLVVNWDAESEMYMNRETGKSKATFFQL